MRVDNGGGILSDVSLGSTVRKGDLLDSITDPMSNAITELRSLYSGRIIGMARHQVAIQSFAAFHVGIEIDEVSASEEISMSHEKPSMIVTWAACPSKLQSL